VKVYIASSWKNQHAVELITGRLRSRGHEVLSFVENNHGEFQGRKVDEGGKPMDFDEWCLSERGQMSFDYDTIGATKSDLVIYVGPSGCDAWAEVGAAWASGVPIIGLISKGEQVGLMRRMATWVNNVRELWEAVDSMQPVAA
jgi:hypothetical protein